MIEVGMHGKFPTELKKWCCNADGTWASVIRADILIGGIFRPHGESWWDVITYHRIPSKDNPTHIINVRDKVLQVATLDQVFDIFKP